MKSAVGTAVDEFHHALGMREILIHLDDAVDARCAASNLPLIWRKVLPRRASA
jgi:hypothetical protein